ncbi:MAG: mfd, partial [Chloroflexi bacterium]|nr:mfd [Chloroflexota bacterium]
MDNLLEPVVNQILLSADELIEAIRTDKPPTRLGLQRSARLPVVAALRRALKTPILLVTDRSDHALLLSEELELWAPDANRLIFPEPNPLFYENAAWGETTRRERLLTLTTLSTYHIPGITGTGSAPIIIASARALMTRTIPRRDFLAATRTLKLGQSAHIDDLLRSWVTLGYEPVNTVIAPGQFARRGGILDLWPLAETYPVRIEFFGDEIETMRRFDPTTQRTLPSVPGAGSASLQRITISPAREYLLPASLTPGMSDHAAMQAFQNVASEYSEFHIPILHSQPASLLDYLPRNTLTLVDDFQLLEDIVAEIEEQAIKSRRDAEANNTLPTDFPIPYLTWPELHDALDQLTTLELGPSGATERLEEEPRPIQNPESLAERFNPGPRFGGRLKPVMDYLHDHYHYGEQIVLVSRQSARLKELWEEQNQVHSKLSANSTDSEPTLFQPLFVENSLSEGWVFQPVLGRVVNLFTDGEIFGWRRPKPRYRRSDRYAIAVEDPETNYSDLRIGDYVVHVDHGIGRFTGLVRRTVDNLEREYLRVEYADEAQLFVPVYQVDRLTRYVGADNRSPTLSRLGSPEWKNTKSNVKEAVQEVAEDLLELY